MSKQHIETMPISEAIRIYKHQGIGASWAFIQNYPRTNGPKRTFQEWKLFLDAGIGQKA